MFAVAPDVAAKSAAKAEAALAEKQAREIMAGRATTPRDVLEIIAVLHQQRQFALARKTLDVVMRNAAFVSAAAAIPALRRKIAHQHAFSTYSDPDIATDLKLQRALDILQDQDPLATSVDQETLGLAGAIYKRRWEHDGRERQLETALAFYRRGFEQGVRSDNGHTGINAALILDVLADLESVDQQPTNRTLAVVGQRRAEARGIRRQIVDELHDLPTNPRHAALQSDWWFLVTLGEAYFGLKDYDNAERWLLQAAALENVADWKRESAARQLALLLRVQRREYALRGEEPNERARQVLSKFLGDAQPALESVIRGKIGLALSGGGFRASLYHIGVLARLAELDLLRHVEYLSCVSGGSIIGAHYYLEVRRLLSSKPDREITREDYVQIVARVCDDFLAGVQRNIRTRIAAEWLTNLKMIFLPNYSRTLRAGELYEREIYARVADGEGNKKRWLNELLIKPAGEPESFRPKEHNWRRAAKVPILVLNATSLNTGHNWQFTATWMGEPPAGIDSEVDANYRLRRMYYEQAPPPHNRIRLGHAVAASACVPGLFEPLTLTNLYERLPVDGDRKVRPIVRLVDGGVHDNQGIAALLEQNCSVLLVSDASGQMADQDEPSNGLLGVPLRANSILQARVRVSQFEELDSRRRAGMLKGLMFVHLKKDLETDPVDWIDSQDRSPPASNQPLAGYGIQRSLQRRLAAIRTDLDSFSDAEAYSLMASGYLMTQHALRQPILGFAVPDAASRDWKFMKVHAHLQAPGSNTWLHRQLKVAEKLAFKVWLVARELQIGAGILGLLLLSYLGVQLYEARDQLGQLWQRPLLMFERPTLGEAAIIVGTTVLTLLGLSVITRLLDYRKTLQQMLIGIGMASVGFLFARLHLHFFDRLFLRQGRVRR